MAIFIKLLMAILLGVLMLVSLMISVIFALFIIGYLAQLFGLNNLADAAFEGQRRVWLKTKQWFLRYKGE